MPHYEKIKQNMYHSETAACPCEHLQSSDGVWQERVPFVLVDKSPLMMKLLSLQTKLLEEQEVYPAGWIMHQDH